MDKKNPEAESNQPDLPGVGLVPNDWSVVPLPEVTNIVLGSSPPSTTYNKDGQGLPFFQGNADFGWLKPVPTVWCSKPQKIAEPTDVLISVRAPVGDLNLAAVKSCIGRGVAAIQSNPETLNNLYLYYHLEERKTWIASLAAGSTFKAIRSSDFERLDVALPKIDDQRKIASVLYTVDQLIEKTEATIRQSKRLRRGLIQDLFRYGITEDGTLRCLHAGSGELQETEYGEAPEDWDTVALRDLVPDDSPITYGIVKPGQHYPGGVPVIRVENIVEGRVTEEGLLHTDPKLHKRYSRAEVQAGDLLFSIRGTVGRMAFVPERLEGSNITQDTARIRVRGANPLYVRWYLETELAQSFIKRHIVGQTVKGVNLEDLRRVPVMLPARREQDRIVAILRTLSEYIENGREARKAFERLKSGLMQDLLSGRVRMEDKEIEIVEAVAAYG